MKRKATKILGVVLLFMIAFKPFCYADVVDPAYPRGGGITPGSLQSVGGRISDVAVLIAVAIAVISIVTISIIVLIKNKKEEKNDK